MRDGPDRRGTGEPRDRSPTCRRSLLRRGVAGSLALAGLPVSGAAAGAGEPAAANVTLSFEDQTTDGREVVIAELQAPRDVMVSVTTDGHETVYVRRDFDAGSYTDHAVTLDRLLTEDRLLEVSVYPSGGGEALAMDRAEVVVADDVSFVDGVPVNRVDADPDAGFHYPYFLYAPRSRESKAGGPILVEPNNTGTSSDDFQKHLNAAREIAEGKGNGGTGRTLSERLAVPFLVPAFPRPRSEPVDWRHYTHQLDTETMRIDGGPLERIDRQLLRMVEHARERLSGTFPVDEGMLLNGFSASGNFVNRFAALHPEEVVSVTAGGVNGMAILPVSEAKGHELNYQIGVADVEELTGEPFDLDAFREVDQFLHMGALDANDTLPYDDAWSEEQREIALDVYGPNMQRDRFPYCKSVYEDNDVSAAFKIYEGEGHTPMSAIDDMVAFHRASMAGEDISDFGDNVGASDGGEGAPPRPVVDYAPAEPQAGERVEFDAGDSTAPTGEIVAYTWAFGDGETAAGRRPTHVFGEAGEHTVELTAIDGDGQSATEAATVSVRPAATAAGSPTTDESGPGFGVAAALSGLGGLAALLGRRDGDGE